MTLADLKIGQDAVLRTIGGQGELRHHLLAATSGRALVSGAHSQVTTKPTNNTVARSIHFCGSGRFWRACVK